MGYLGKRLWTLKRAYYAIPYRKVKAQLLTRVPTPILTVLGGSRIILQDAAEGQRKSFSLLTVSAGTGGVGPVAARSLPRGLSFLRE
jgi:hypothetical protein